MSAIFPKWSNRLPVLIIVGVLLGGTAVTAGVWYYFTPKYTRVGYQPIQPVPFPHSVHVDQLGLDCRYCHSAVEKSWYSNVPAAGTCINCHGPKNGNILGNDLRLALVRESAEWGKPIPWCRFTKCRTMSTSIIRAWSRRELRGAAVPPNGWCITDLAWPFTWSVTGIPPPNCVPGQDHGPGLEMGCRSAKGRRSADRVWA